MRAAARKDRDLRLDLVGVVQRSSRDGHEARHFRVPAEQATAARRAKEVRDSAAAFGGASELGQLSADGDAARWKHRARQMRRTADPLAVAAIAMRDDDRVAFNLVPDFAAQA